MIAHLAINFEYALRMLYSLFESAAKHHQKPVLHQPIAAYCVLEPLACELYLKALSAWERRSDPRRWRRKYKVRLGTYLETHSLAFLFADLRRETRAEIRRRFEEWRSSHPDWIETMEIKNKTKSDFDSMLRRNSKAFVRWRYGHEFRRLEWTFTELVYILRKMLNERMPNFSPHVALIPDPTGQAVVVTTSPPG